MSPSCDEFPWDSCRKSNCIVEEETKSSGTNAVGFSRTSSDISTLNDTCVGPPPTNDGVYKRRKLQGMSFALLSDENARSTNAVHGSTICSDSQLLTTEKEIVALSPISCVNGGSKKLLDNRDQLISRQHCALKPAATSSSQLDTSPKSLPCSISYMRKNKVPQHRLPDDSTIEEKVPNKEYATNLNKSVIQHSVNANDRCSSSKCNMELGSTSTNMKTEVEDAGECSSSVAVLVPFGEFTSAKELCIYVLKSHGLLSGGCIPSPCPSEILSSCDDSPSQSCKICGQLDKPLKMLICDLCEEAFHLSCCNPRVKKLPVDEWYCQPCFRKKPKSFLQNSAEKSFNSYDAKLEKRRRTYRDLDPISFMLKDTEPYTTGVRIGEDFQAEVPDWSGPFFINHDYFGEPSEIDPTVSTSLNEWHGYKSAKTNSIGNWIQCQEVIGTSENGEEIVCGKWRRAPLFVVQTDDWDCSCALPWDPIHADCAVPQELETQEVLKHLKYIDMLRPRLAEKKRKINQM